MVQELGGENAQCVVGRFLSCMGCIKGHLEHGNLKGCTHTGKQSRELTQQITAPTMQNKMEYNNYSIQKKAEKGKTQQMKKKCDKQKIKRMAVNLNSTYQQSY